MGARSRGKNLSLSHSRFDQFAMMRLAGSIARGAQLARFSPVSGTPRLLQRKCACGGKAHSGGAECPECRRRKLLGQRPPLVQPKLIINEPGDRFEQEADRVADQIMRMPADGVNPAMSLLGKPMTESPQLGLQRQSADEREGNEEFLRTKRQGPSETGAGNDASSPPVALDVLRSPGRPIDAAARGFMESRFGHDFSRVRLHTDARAAESAQEIQARAYTVGRHIVFGAGMYAPHSNDGRLLLGHELTHVLQQQSPTFAGVPIQRQDLPLDGPTLEGEERPAPGEAESAPAETVEDEESSVGEQLVGGGLLGDFIEEPTFWQTIGQIIVGFIPYAGQVADIRDLIAILHRLIFRGAWRDPFEWLNLILVLIGFIPGLGDIIKSVGRGGLRWLRNSRFLGRAIRFIEEQVIRRAADAIRPLILEAVARIKRELSDLLERVRERLRRATGAPGPSAQARRAAQRAEAQQNELYRMIQEVEERAQRQGRSALDSLSQADRDWVNADPRHLELSFNPADRRNSFTDGSVREARAGLAAESQGILQAPIRRDPTGGAEFIDGASVHWDVKNVAGFNLDDDATSVIRELTSTEHSVLVNLRDLNPVYGRQLLGEIQARLIAEGRGELADRIRVVRTEVSATAIRTGRVILRGAQSEGEGE